MAVKKIMGLRVTIIVFLTVFTGGPALFAEDNPSPVTWKPDPRAVKSGLYIMPMPSAKKESVAFTVTEPSGVERKNWPVRGSIPLFRGQLTDPDKIRLLDENGKSIPVQGMATAYWPEKTIRFLCLDFIISRIKAGETKTFTLEYGTGVSPEGSTEIQVKKADGFVAVYTGKAEFTFKKAPEFVAVKLRNSTLVPVRPRMILAKDAKGTGETELPFAVDDIRVTEQGPVQVTVHVTGHYGDKKAFHKITYYNRQPSTTKDTWRFPVSMFFRIYAGTSHVYLEHTFGFNGDEYSEFVKSYGLVIRSGMKGARFLYGPDIITQAASGLGVRLNQYDHNAWALTGPENITGKRFGGWGAVASDDDRVFVAMREAWQNWPVAIQATKDGDILYEILGEKPDRALDLRWATPSPLKRKEHHRSHSWYSGEKLGSYYINYISIGFAAGMRKIHELVLDFSSSHGNMKETDIGRAFQRPLVPWPGKGRFKETKALGHIGVYDDPKWDHKKRYYSILLDVYPVIHEANGLYGWVDWGDVPMCKKPENGKFRLLMDGGLGWANGERALVTYFYHYAATGMRRFLDLGRSMVHHTIGMDTEHEGGDYPHGDYHRHDQCHWREREPETSRQGGFRGWHVYHWMTGDPEVRRLALSAGIDAPAYQDKLNVSQNTETPYFKIGGACSSVHFLAHYCWITTGDWRYAACHHAISRVVERMTANESESAGSFTVNDGEPGNLKHVKPGLSSGNAGYFYTYGEDDLLLEWAALTGDTAAVNALILLGRRHEDPKIRNRSSVYHQPEALYAGYAFLDRKNPEIPKMLAQRGGRPRKDLSKKKNIPSSYASAEDWARYRVNIYGKNGFSIHAPPALNILHMILAREVIEREVSPSMITLPEFALAFAYDTDEGAETRTLTLNGMEFVRDREKELVNSFEWLLDGKPAGTGKKGTLKIPLGLHEIGLKMTDQNVIPAQVMRTVMVCPYGKRKYSFGGGPEDFINGHRRYSDRFGYGWDENHSARAYTSPKRRMLNPEDRPHGCGFISIWRAQNFQVKMPAGKYKIEMGGAKRSGGHGEVRLQGKVVEPSSSPPRGEKDIWSYRGEVESDENGLIKVGFIRGKNLPVISYILLEKLAEQ